MILTRAGWCPPPSRFECPANEVHVWRTTLGWPDAALAALERILSPSEIERMRRFRFARDQRQSLVSRGLLRLLLGRYLGLDPKGLRFDATLAGKPSLSAGQTAAPLHFNVSHSGDMLLIALTRGRLLGVDVEQIRPDLAVTEIAGRFFSAQEQEALAGLATDLQRAAFFDCWTRKEAFIKAKGDGLALPLDQFDVAFLPGEAARLLGTRPDPAEASRWQLAALDVAEGYKAALAVEGFGWTLKGWDWPPRHGL